MSDPVVTKLLKSIVQGPASANASVTKLVKFIVVDTLRSDTVTPPRKRAPQVFIRYSRAPR